MTVFRLEATALTAGRCLDLAIAPPDREQVPPLDSDTKSSALRIARLRQGANGAPHASEDAYVRHDAPQTNRPVSARRSSKRAKIQHSSKGVSALAAPKSEKARGLNWKPRAH